MTASIVQSHYGPMLVPHYDQYVTKAIISQGAYCPDELADWVPYLKKGATVLDIGANVGAHTLAFARYVGLEGRVVAAEAQWGIFAMLCGTLALNDCSNVRAKWCAVGKEIGTHEIATPDYSKPNNFGAFSLGIDSQRETVTVETIDSWNMDRVDFLKIDVEGMEFDVLQGALQTVAKFRPVIVAEMDTQVDRTAQLDWLSDREYSLWRQACPLGDAFGKAGSFNVIALPAEKDLPSPTSKWCQKIEAVAA